MNLLSKKISPNVLANIIFIEKSRIKVIDLISVISASLALASAFIGRDSTPYAFSMIGLAGIFISALIFNLNAKSMLSKYFVPIATTVWICYMCIAFGHGLGTENYLVIALVALAIYAKNNSYRSIGILTILGMAVFVNVFQSHSQPIYKLPEFAKVLHTINVITPLAIISLICLNVIRDAAKSNATIDQQRQDLEGSNQFKDKVLSIIGHDMKAPFNSAKSLLYLLENEMLSDEEKQHIIGQLHEDINLSLQTLENILGWASQAYYGAVLNTKIKKQKLDLSFMINQTITAFSHLAAEKQVHIESLVQPSTYAFADEQQVAFVLRNLTSNALKFSHQGKIISFLNAKDNGNVIISVKDQGVGMTKEMLSSLFQINTRFSVKGTKNEKGSGLGLIFCQEFIENNEGKLWFNSTPGIGTTVNFSLPKP